MPKYRVKQGKKFGPGGRYPAGTILELSEREAKPFSDILERADDNALVGSTQAVVPHEDLQFENELEVEIPDDLKMMPGTLSATDDDLELAPEEDLPETLEDLPEDATRKPPSQTPSKRKSAGRSTRKGATEE